jgi:hypothetical protein
MAALHLQEFTTVTSQDGKQIQLVSGHLTDHSDLTKQHEYIIFQIAVELPTHLNAAILRSEVLRQASEKLYQLSQHFDQIGRQRSV